jgi:hypothetical protein
MRSYVLIEWHSDGRTTKETFPAEDHATAIRRAAAVSDAMVYEVRCGGHLVERMVQGAPTSPDSLQQER